MLRASTSILRDYQTAVKNEIIRKHALGIQNVLAVVPTGGGKTVVMADIARDNNQPEIIIAHRQELVSQISMSLARAGVYHRIIAPQSTVNFIIERQVDRLRKNFTHPNAPLAVAGVDTLVRRTDQLARFLKQCNRWQTDEGHHIQKDNKWGAAVQALPNAFGVGWTATPVRPNGQSLSRLRTGIYDSLVIGPTMRALINQGYLCDYKIYGPPSDIDLSNVLISSATGDFNTKQLRDAAHKSHITGDVVGHYLRLAKGKRGVTFAVDVEMAEEHAAAFREAGVPAAVLHAKTPDRDRVKFMDDFEAGRLLQIVNVDVLGEGYDCPAIECVSFARPTQSYGLYVQQFGRGLRPLPGKKWGTIIDHVGNVTRHGLPDAPRAWDLDGIGRNTRPVDDLPIRTCFNLDCLMVFEGYGRTCPYCGSCPERQTASRPDVVEGDLQEFSPDLLARLRGEADRIVNRAHQVPVHLGKGIAATVRDAKAVWRDTQLELRDAIAWWAGVRRDIYGEDDSTGYRRFWRTFGVDVATAQTLKADKAAELLEKVRKQTDEDYALRRVQ